MISREGQREPRLEIGRVGVPFFGRDFEKLAPGQSAVIDATDLGTPAESIAQIPAGEYYVQAFISVYSEFKRADGHTVWMHDDQWEGQRWNRSPGNLYSTPKKIALDAAKRPTRDDLVSIHAPARGATRRRLSPRGRGRRFDPRPREGGDRTCPSRK